MSVLFYNISRTQASPISRRRAFKLIVGTLIGAVLTILEFGYMTSSAEAIDCDYSEVCPEGTTVPPGLVCSCPNCRTCVASCGSRVENGDRFLDLGCICRDCATAIKLISFIATPGNDGSVTLTWQTATEIDTAGFNLYRARTEGGPYDKINGALIPAQGDPVAGASYSFVDSPEPGTFRYILIDVETSGQITLHGPVQGVVKVRQP